MFYLSDAPYLHIIIMIAEVTFYDGDGAGRPGHARVSENRFRSSLHVDDSSRRDVNRPRDWPELSQPTGPRNMFKMWYHTNVSDYVGWVLYGFQKQLNNWTNTTRIMITFVVKTRQNSAFRRETIESDGVFDDKEKAHIFLPPVNINRELIQLTDYNIYKFLKTLRSEHTRYYALKM